jgi:HAD superfamily hydrolase (TIGR01484 family)
MMFIGNSPSVSELRDVRYLFTDIDDTLTTDGQLLPQTYQSLWDLSRAGIAIVPVTGGSAGWCEHIVRAWPVAAVIGESGAFSVSRRNGEVVFDFWENEALQVERQRRHLQAVRQLIETKYQSFRIAHDQAFRLADVAIDIGGRRGEEIDGLAAKLRTIGATVAISSIHINTWVGDYDKRTMSERLVSQMFKIDPQAAPLVMAFVGDSRNDASMFGFIRNSFGVRNIEPVLAQLPHKPRWISGQPAGLGFVEVAKTLLDAKA